MSAIHHSATVHIPLALAVLFPLGYVGLLLCLKLKFLPEKSWTLLWVLCVVQLITSYFAYNTGLRDLAFSTGSTELLQNHREHAWKFFVLWLGISGAFPVAFLVGQRKLSRFVHLVLLGLLIAQFITAWRLGELGGRLVFG